jgi:8-oxo-dGTP pyrophosphatase MutT (NUDIX family)
MHRLQQHILSQLIRNPNRRYADLKPAEVEGNLFMYHMKSLMKAGYVEKADSVYRLTPEGLRYADGLSLETFAPRKQPRIVTLLVCRNETGQYLLLKRNRQPLLGKTGFPYGKIHLGETIAQAAARELHEKAGLSATLVHRGDGYVTIYDQAEPVSEIFFHLFAGTNVSGRLKSGKGGEVFWGNVDLRDPSLMPSVPDLIRQLNETDGRFFTELVYHQSGIIA